MAAHCWEASSSRKCVTRSGTSAGGVDDAAPTGPAASSTIANSAKRNDISRVPQSLVAPAQLGEDLVIDAAAPVAGLGGRIGLGLERQRLRQRPHAVPVETVPAAAEKQRPGLRP